MATTERQAKTTAERLTDTQRRDLGAIDRGLSRGEHYGACESLVRRGYLTGDWVTGYYVTVTGRAALALAGREG